MNFLLDATSISSPKSNLKSIAFDEVTLIDCLTALEVKSSKLVKGALTTLGVKVVTGVCCTAGSGVPRLKFVNKLSNLKLVFKSSPPRSNLNEVFIGADVSFSLYNLYF